MHVSFDVELNMKKPKFDAGDHVQISKYKHIWKTASQDSLESKILLTKTVINCMLNGKDIFIALIVELVQVPFSKTI